MIAAAERDADAPLPDAALRPEGLPGYGKYFGPDYYGEQDENGVDLSLIRENLKLTPLERLRKHERARLQTLKLLEFGRRHRENLARGSAPPIAPTSHRSAVTALPDPTILCRQAISGARHAPGRA